MQPAGTHAGRAERGDQLDRPRFRQDLVAELIDEQGARFIDVMDPDSGNLFRFYEVEYSLACAMDGERDVPGIVKWAQEELGMTPSQQEVRNVIATLGDLGFIDTGAQAASPDLAGGVVVGNQVRGQAAAQVDLGTAGGAPHQRVPSVTPAPDFALGAPGAAARRPHDPVEDVPLGAPGRRPGRPTPSGSPPPMAAAGDEGDVSLDLADHINVGRADVQEAVRASKVMAAVDVPQSVLDAIEDRPTARAASPTVDRPPEILRGPEPRPEMRPEARPEARPEMRPEARPEMRPSEVRVGKSPLTRSPSGPLKPVVELPKPPAHLDKQVPGPAPRPSRVSPVLLVVLVLAVLGGAAYLIYRYLSGPSRRSG
ncbi:MAG TPA: hypothetical protein VFD36_02260, partial [Kofleriaceae bacterium]|nr:hypothetical protein [Kofleriaceae bacterium]